MRSLLAVSMLTFGVAVIGSSQAVAKETVKVEPTKAEPFDIAAFDRKGMGEAWLKQVEGFRENNAKQAAGGIVMVGDSITAGFPVAAHFPDKHIVNRGISGDRIIGVISRLEESVYALKPSKLFLMIGVNDTLFPEMGPDEYLRQYEYLFTQIQSHCPKAKVYVLSIMPLWGKYADNNKMIRKVNPRLAKLAHKHGFKVIDTQKVFCDANGEMKHELADDGTHPNAKGQAVFRDLIKPYIEK